MPVSACKPNADEVCGICTEIPGFELGSFDGDGGTSTMTTTTGGGAGDEGPSGSMQLSSSPASSSAFSLGDGGSINNNPRANLPASRRGSEASEKSVKLDPDTPSGVDESDEEGGDWDEEGAQTMACSRLDRPAETQLSSTRKASRVSEEAWRPLPVRDCGTLITQGL